MKTFIALILLGLVAAAHAGIDCEIGGTRLKLVDGEASFNYSPSGKPGASGEVSLFRLLGLGPEGGPLGSFDMKTVNVSKPGDHALSMKPTWRSALHFDGKRQRVTGGKFSFTRFEIREHVGRAAGRVEFTTDKTSGSCSFDVEIHGINRDRLAP
jgi:hypothetical protein